MRKLISIGGLLLTGVAVTAVSLAASGYVAYVLIETDPVTLTGPQKTQVGAAVNATFGVPSANVDDEHCHLTQDGAGPTQCTVCGDVAVSDEEWWALWVAGELKDPSAVATVRCRTKILTSSQDTQHRAAAATVFGFDEDELFAWRYKRDDENHSIIIGAANPIKIASKAQCRADVQAGLVARPLGEVE